MARWYPLLLSLLHQQLQQLLMRELRRRLLVRERLRYGLTSWHGLSLLLLLLVLLLAKCVLTLLCDIDDFINIILATIEELIDVLVARVIGKIDITEDAHRNARLTG